MKKLWFFIKSLFGYDAKKVLKKSVDGLKYRSESSYDSPWSVVRDVELDNGTLTSLDVFFYIAITTQEQGAQYQRLYKDLIDNLWDIKVYKCVTKGDYNTRIDVVGSDWHGDSIIIYTYATET